MFSSLFFSSIPFSLNEIININKLNKNNTVWKNRKLDLVIIAAYWDNETKIKEVKKIFTNDNEVNRSRKWS